MFWTFITTVIRLKFETIWGLLWVKRFLLVMSANKTQDKLKKNDEELKFDKNILEFGPTTGS